MKKNNENFVLLTGLIGGVAAGFLAGILLAPDSGKSTREKLRKGCNNCREEFERVIHQIKDLTCDKKTENEALEAITKPKKQKSTSTTRKAKMKK